jgi:hypothetical protein
MIAVMFLSLAAGWGARDLLVRRPRGAATVMTCGLALFWLAETWHAPVPLNGVIGSDIEGIGNPPSTALPGNRPSPLVAWLRALPRGSALIEFPFAAGGWEMHYVYMSTFHWHPIVNGFSGFTPRRYALRAEALRDVSANPAFAWQQLAATGATHAVVHGSAYARDDHRTPDRWLEDHGALRVATFGEDRVYVLPSAPSAPSPGSRIGTREMR